MDNLKSPRVFITLVLGITILLTILFGALYLYRFSQGLRAQSIKEALLSAQIFAESLSSDEQPNQLRMVTQAFVQGDVLYAQIVRGGNVAVEKRAEAALELELPVENFSGDLTQRERRLKDGTPYLDILRPFTGESSALAGTAPDYVRAGFSLREMEGLLKGESLTVVGVGLLIIIVMGLFCGAYGLIFRGVKYASAPHPQGFPAEFSTDSANVASKRELVRAGSLQIDPMSKEVRLRENQVDLSPKEYELVSLLASEPGRVFSTREILQKIWTEGNGATAKDVKQYIYLLRKKLESDPEHPQVIVTVRGFGYKLTSS
jgi:DNA-binding winged helix-turn-helix (wHTH) protein